jgi:hypothetical protein
LRRIQNIHAFITKPYAEGRILDLARSSHDMEETNPGIPY